MYDKDRIFGTAVSADRKVSPGYGFTAVPECKNCISAPPHLPAAPCKNTVFALLRKTFRSTECIKIREIPAKQKGHPQLQMTFLFSWRMKSLAHPVFCQRCFEGVAVLEPIRKPVSRCSVPPLLLPGLTIGFGDFRIGF
jgi:hypothetical protein